MKLAYIVLCVFLLPYCLKAESADSLRLMRTKELKAVFDSLGVADPEMCIRDRACSADSYRI